MKVLFISCTRHSEPLGIMQLAACLKAAGHEVQACMIENEDPAQRVADFRPDIVAYSMMSCEYVRLKEVNTRLRLEFDFFSLAGGPHPTYEPSMLQGSGFDAICVGEGEEAMEPSRASRLVNISLARSTSAATSTFLDCLYVGPCAGTNSSAPMPRKPV